nr:MAG TPA: D1 dopamine receptor-interacting protein (calcyon) [Caudoviricetes sp.]
MIFDSAIAVIAPVDVNQLQEHLKCLIHLFVSRKYNDAPVIAKRGFIAL